MYRQGKLEESTDDQTQKNVDDPQDTNDSDNEEDNAIDLETRSYKSTSVATLTSDFFTNSSLF